MDFTKSIRRIRLSVSPVLASACIALAMPSIAEAVCDPGFYGPGCAECPGGTGTPCHNHGICDDGDSGSGTCSCFAGYSGFDCGDIAISSGSISSINPSTIGAGSRPSMTFAGATASPTSRVAFAPAGQCSNAALRVAETALPTTDTEPLTTAISGPGTYKVCYTVDNGTSWVEQSLPTLTVVEATPTSISAITPSSITESSQPPVTFTGAVPTPTTYVAFAPAGQCGNAAAFQGVTALPNSDTANLGTPISGEGVYRLCYSVDGAVFTEQTQVTLTVASAQPGSISSISPSTIGAGSQPTMSFTGALPTPTTKIAFALTGQCATSRVGTTDLPDTDTAPLGSSITDPGTYKVCYTVDNGSTWVQQTAPSLVVTSAMPSSITMISPSSIAAGSQPPITFTGAVPTTTTAIAFAQNNECGTHRLAETPLTVTNTAPISSALSGSIYQVCYTVDGVDWVQQTAPSLLVYGPCPPGEYDTGSACAHCDDTCETCDGGFADDCLTCPDGSPVSGGYCVLPGECPPTPSTCALAAKGSLSMRYDVLPASRFIKWKWSQGADQTAQSDFGDPVAGGTSYAFCIYGDTGGDSLIASATIPAAGTCANNPCWKPISTKGWLYKSDDGATSSGVRAIKMLGGAPGKPGVGVTGKGSHLVMTPPLSTTQFVDPGTPVTVEIHSSDPEACWSTTFDNFTKNDGVFLKAKAP